MLLYIKARISSRIVQFSDIKPVSMYLLEKKIHFQEILYKQLLESHKIDLFDLNGGYPEIVFKISDEKGIWRMAPPIIEMSKADNNQPVLLDGEHRFYLAKKLNKPIRVIWIENVNPNFPVVSLPLNWSDVRLYKKVPPLNKKRRFRYQDFKNFPDISGFSNIKITPDNFKYFFYRDLNPVCTSGIRESEDI